MLFSTKTKKWDAEIKTEEKWEKQMSDLTSVFIPAKEILSNAWNLDAIQCMESGCSSKNGKRRV